MPRTETALYAYQAGKTSPIPILSPYHLESCLPKPGPGLRSQASIELAVCDAEMLIKQSADLDEALVGLTQLLGTRLPVAFCRLLLADKDLRSLTAKAAYSVIGLFDSELELSHSIPLTVLPDGLRLAHLRYSLVGPYRELSVKQKLSAYSNSLGMGKPLTTLLLVPLKHNGQLLGVIELGEIDVKTTQHLKAEDVQAIVLYTPRLAGSLMDRFDSELCSA